MGRHLKRFKDIRFSKRRLERLARIWPEQRPRETAEKADRALKRKILFAAAAGALLCLTILLSGAGKKPVVAVVLLTIALIAAMIAGNGSKEREDAEKAKKKAKAAYPGFAREFAILFSAGYSVRGAWSHLAAGYRDEKRRTGKRSALGEELLITERSMLEGMPEREALLGFSDRLGLIGYMRLCGLLIAAARTGREDMCDALRLEAEEAEHARLEEAKKQGELLTARFLMPTIILFALIMAMLVMPAFLSW